MGLKIEFEKASVREIMGYSVAIMFVLFFFVGITLGEQKGYSTGYTIGKETGTIEIQDDLKYDERFACSDGCIFAIAPKHNEYYSECLEVVDNRSKWVLAMVDTSEYCSSLSDDYYDEKFTCLDRCEEAFPWEWGTVFE